MKNSVPINVSPQDRTAAQNIKEDARRPAKKPPKKITEKYLYNAGLAYLERFPASVPHFRRVMTRKIDKSCRHHTDQDRETCLQLLDATVATFERQGMLNDEAYLQGMVHSLRRRGLSMKAIQYKLQQKGLAADRIKETLTAFDDGIDPGLAELIAAVQLMKRKRLGCFAKEPAEKHLAALARAGFGFDIAQKALRLSLDEAEQILSQRSL